MFPNRTATEVQNWCTDFASDVHTSWLREADLYAVSIAIHYDSGI